MTVIIPRRMRSLRRDSRGYPVPFVVLRDKAGKPQFTVNDSRLIHDCRTKHLCSICGKRLEKGVWFVSGSRAFLHEHGAFNDPPVHLECGEYALQVCPFLAAARYNRAIGGAKLDDTMFEPKIDKNGAAYRLGLVTPESVGPTLPELFGFGLTHVYCYENQFFKVKQWDYIEFWRGGAPCDAASGEPLPFKPRL